MKTMENERRSKMKKLLWMLLALLLAAAPGLAEAGALDEGDATPYAVFAMDEYFFFGAGNALYRCAPGGTPEKFITGLPHTDSYFEFTDQPAFHALLAEGDWLYGLNLDTGALHRFPLRAGAAALEQTLQLDFLDYIVLDEADNYQWTQRPVGLAISGGRLFCLGARAEEMENFLCAYDLDTGARTVYAAKNIQRIAPYREGKLLAMTLDAAADDGKNRPALAVFDPETDALSPLGVLEENYYRLLPGLAYDAATDVCYYLTPNRAYRWAEGKSQLCAYVPFSFGTWESYGALAAVGDTLGLLSPEGFLMRSADPEKLPAQTLTIYNGKDNEAHRRAAAALEGVPVLTDTGNYAPDELAQALVSGQMQADILWLRSGEIDLQRLMEKGYLLDLTEDAALSAFADSLYPALQSAARDGAGRLFALPVETIFYGLGANMDALSSMGEEAPNTILELCQFLDRWGREALYEAHSEYQPFMWAGDYRAHLMELTLERWDLELAAQGKPATLAGDSLRQALLAAAAVDSSAWAVSAEGEGWEAYAMEEELFGKANIFEAYMDYSPEPMIGCTPLLLGVGADSTPCAGVEAYVLAVNPRSENRQAALEYLRQYCAALSDRARAALQPGWDQPILNAYMQEQLLALEEQIDDLTARLAQAAPQDKQALEDSLAQARAQAEIYESSRYSVTLESLAAYRGLMEKAVLRQPSLLDLNQSGELRSLLERCAAGQLSVEQFLDQGEAKLRLLRLEEAR